MTSLATTGMIDGVGGFAPTSVMPSVFLLLVVVVLLISPYQGAAMEPAR